MPWPLVKLIDGRDVLLNRCLPSTDTATTAPSETGSCHAEYRISDSDTFAERPVQSDDLEIQDDRERHPKQVGQEKPDRQGRITADPEHEGSDRCPQERDLDQGPVRSL